MVMLGYTCTTQQIYLYLIGQGTQNWIEMIVLVWW